MYGRRLRLKRAPRRFPTIPQPTSRPIPRPPVPRNLEEIASILDDYASGELPRVPRSAFCVDSSSATLRRYGDIIERIVRWRRYLKEWRAEHFREWRDEATSHMDAAKTLTDDANLLETNKEMKELLRKASNSLKKINTFEKHYDMVFVYDIGEITMLSKNYIAEFTTMFPEIDSYSLFKLTEKVVDSVNLTREEMARKEVISTFYRTDGDIEYWRRVAPKYEALSELYHEIRCEYKRGDPAISQELCNKIGMGEEFRHLQKTVTQLQKKVHQRWRCVRKCLELVEQKSRSTPGKYANVVLTEEEAAFGAAQLLVSGHNSYIPMGNIYSTSTLDIDAVFKKLEARFGETCVFVYVSSLETSDLPDMQLNNHWPVEATDSIKKLYRAQKKYLF